MTALSIQAAETVAQPIAHSVSPQVRRIVLTGFMGAGKSTVGRILAGHLGWTFLDLDAHLEARAGATVPELFALHGEPQFRRLESSALASALREPQLVLALGGGAPETLTNRLLLEQTPGTVTVFLDAPFATLFDRCMLQALNPGEGTEARDADRPNLRDADAARSRFETRHPLYRRLARLTIETTQSTPAETALAILGGIQRIA